ncbi:MAG: 4-hydroxy-3-methylbut-2-enyl diphosphate reductase [Actinobacteria bacterium]|nr:4-hydroxy-3-methylbut-2-enyl diphosphate reductase [Actinomycetota bacterium]
MEIKVARYAGFCPGVRRALRLAEETLAGARGKVFSLGPIIHNPHVVGELQERGLQILPEDEEVLRGLSLRGALVVVRSHGIPPATAALLREKGAALVDATCPTVKKAQRAAMRLVKEGYHLFIVGDAAHPEVAAILGHVGGNAEVIKDTQELKEWWSKRTEKVRKVGLIAQTTVDLLTFRSLLDGLINEVPEVMREVGEMKLINTLCRNTLARQAEALKAAFDSDLVVVVGGKESSNTEFMRKICATAGTRTIKVEAAGELTADVLQGARKVTVLGGASTPGKSVQEVRDRLEELSVEAEAGDP